MFLTALPCYGHSWFRITSISFATTSSIFFIVAVLLVAHRFLTRGKRRYANAQQVTPYMAFKVRSSDAS